MTSKNDSAKVTNVFNTTSTAIASTTPTPQVKRSALLGGSLDNRSDLVVVGNHAPASRGATPKRNSPWRNVHESKQLMSKLNIKKYGSTDDLACLFEENECSLAPGRHVPEILPSPKNRAKNHQKYSPLLNRRVSFDKQSSGVTDRVKISVGSSHLEEKPKLYYQNGHKKSSEIVSNKNVQSLLDESIASLDVLPMKPTVTGNNCISNKKQQSTLIDKKQLLRSNSRRRRASLDDASRFLDFQTYNSGSPVHLSRNLSLDSCFTSATIVAVSTAGCDTLSPSLVTFVEDFKNTQKKDLFQHAQTSKVSATSSREAGFKTEIFSPIHKPMGNYLQCLRYPDNSVCSFTTNKTNIQSVDKNLTNLSVSYNDSVGIRNSTRRTLNVNNARRSNRSSPTNDNIAHGNTCQVRTSPRNRTTYALPVNRKSTASQPANTSAETTISTAGSLINRISKQENSTKTTSLCSSNPVHPTANAKEGNSSAYLGKTQFQTNNCYYQHVQGNTASSRPPCTVSRATANTSNLYPVYRPEQPACDRKEAAWTPTFMMAGQNPHLTDQFLSEKQPRVPLYPPLSTRDVMVHVSADSHHSNPRGLSAESLSFTNMMLGDKQSHHKSRDGRLSQCTSGNHERSYDEMLQTDGDHSATISKQNELIIALRISNEKLRLCLEQERIKREEMENILQRERGYIKSLEESVRDINNRRIIIDPALYRKIAGTYLNAQKQPVRRTCSSVTRRTGRYDDLVCDSSPDNSLSPSPTFNSTLPLFSDDTTTATFNNSGDIRSPESHSATSGFNFDSFASSPPSTSSTGITRFNSLESDNDSQDLRWPCDRDESTFSTDDFLLQSSTGSCSRSSIAKNVL